MRRWLRVSAIGVGVALLYSSTAVSQDNASDTARLVEVLRVVPGQVLANIGAGPEALLTIPMAQAVGPSGTVYATDVAQMLGRVRDTIEIVRREEHRGSRGPALGHEFASQCCDGIFIRNVYHHFADPAVMNASLWRSLKPGGRLAVIDFRPVGSEAASPDRRDDGEQHGVLPKTVSQAGFTLISTEDRPARWFIVVVEKAVQ